MEEILDLPRYKQCYAELEDMLIFSTFMWLWVNHDGQIVACESCLNNVGLHTAVKSAVNREQNNCCFLTAEVYSLTLMMTFAEVVAMWVTVTNSAFQDFTDLRDCTWRKKKFSVLCVTHVFCPHDVLFHCSWFQPEMSRQMAEDVLKKEVVIKDSESKLC